MVWSVSSVSVTAKLVNSDATHTDASAVTAASWSLVAIEGHVLAGTSCDLQVTAGGAGTFYVVPLGARIGTRALSLPARPTHELWLDSPPTIKTLTGLGDEATWTDIDVTSNTSALAFMLHGRVAIAEAVSQFRLNVRRKGSSESADNNNEITFVDPNTQSIYNDFPIILDDQQRFQYFLDRTSGSSTLDFGLMFAVGYRVFA